MGNDKRSNIIDAEYRDIVREIKPFVEQSTEIKATGTGYYFPSLLAASFLRSYTYIEACVDAKIEHGLIMSAGLRGICEEIIVLNYLSKLQECDREEIIIATINLDVAEKLKYQQVFFKKFRPFQPTLSLPKETDMKSLRGKVQSSWRKHGWPNLNQIRPPTQQIAAKSDPEVLDVLYEFLFRLTSSSVHFDSQTLLNSGWGNPKNEWKFSSSHMGLYWLSCSSLYGALIFCLYFEYFEQHLKPTEDIEIVISRLRKKIISIFRWPEMVTFEEMNVPVPQPDRWPTVMIFAMYTMEFEKSISNAIKNIANSLQD